MHTNRDWEAAHFYKCTTFINKRSLFIWFNFIPGDTSYIFLKSSKGLLNLFEHVNWHTLLHYATTPLRTTHHYLRLLRNNCMLDFYSKHNSSKMQYILLTLSCSCSCSYGTSECCRVLNVGFPLRDTLLETVDPNHYRCIQVEQRNNWELI